MLRIYAVTLVCTLHAMAIDPIWGVTFGSGANSFNMEFVSVGNPGNSPDTTGSPIPVGSVPYAYGIGMYEVSTDMVVKANAQGRLGITLDNRPAQKPATNISWFEAAQFVNWLNTTTGFSPAYKFNALNEFQRWQPSDPGYDPTNLYRNMRARYVLPNVHEWYKAAYHNPSAGTAGIYFDYATGSNTVPTAVVGGVDPGTAVFDQIGGAPADVQLAGGTSRYGTIGQGGNVYEWEETDLDLINDSVSFRGYRGGAWNLPAFYLAADERTGAFPNREAEILGFRVVSLRGADINRDGTVDAADAAIMFADWGMGGEGDINADGVIDASDAGLLFSEWNGDAMPVVNLPEPSLAFLVSGIVLLGITLGSSHRRPVSLLGK